MVATTPADQSLFFGFHDVMPFAADDGSLLVHRIDPTWQDMPSTTGAAEICRWNPATGAIEVLGRTTTWNFQQGARLQWVPHGEGRFVYNRLSQNGLVAAICSAEGTVEHELEGGLYTIAADGTWGLTVDFIALAHRWPAYGYAALRDRPDKSADPDASGLVRVDFNTGASRVLVSLAQVLEQWQAPNGAGAGHFLSHPSISPDGSRIVFLHRFFSPDGGLFTRLLACDAAGRGLRLIAQEKVSHFDWLDGHSLLVWARFGGGGFAQMRAAGSLDRAWLRPLLKLARRFTGRWKKRLLAESYYAIDVDDPSQRKAYGWPVLDADGHPMIARSHDWLVTDTYPDATGTMPLILQHRVTGRRIDVARIHDGVTSTDTDAKCDLHPRWSRDETRIAVDFCRDGKRGLAIFDVGAVVGKVAG